MIERRLELTAVAPHELGVDAGETTPDGKFTLSEVECLAYCECAPAMRFDDRYEGNLTPEKIDRLIAEVE